MDAASAVTVRYRRDQGNDGIMRTESGAKPLKRSPVLLLVAIQLLPVGSRPFGQPADTLMHKGIRQASERFRL